MHNSDMKVVIFFWLLSLVVPFYHLVALSTFESENKQISTMTTPTMDDMVPKSFVATTVKLNATSDPSPVKGSTG